MGSGGTKWESGGRRGMYEVGGEKDEGKRVVRGEGKGRGRE